MPVEWKTLGHAQVAVADCLDAMASLEAGSVDTILGDAPYCSGGYTEAERTSVKAQGVRGDRWFNGDNMTTMGLVWLLRQLSVQAARVLKPGGSLLIFTDWRMVPSLAPALESGGLRWRNLVVWDKGSAGMGWGFRPQHELVLQLANGTLPLRPTKAVNVIRVPRVPARKRLHPTEKPVELLRELIRHTTPKGGVVYDPFAGSGSTAEAAMLEGCQAMLSERDPAFLPVIEARLSKAA